MHDLWEETPSRRALIVAAVTAAGSVGIGLKDHVVRWANHLQGDDALPHIAAACSSLQANYELLVEAGLTTPIDLYTLDIQTLDQNLADAKAAKTRADEQSGLPGANQHVEQAIAEVDQYIAFQHLLFEAFSIPGAADEKRLTDTHITTVLDALDQSAPEETPDDTPYGADTYADTIDAAAKDLTFNTVGDHLAHTPEDIVAIAQTGLEPLTQLETLYQKLHAHLSVPDLHRTVVETDQALSHAHDPATIATGHRMELERARSHANFGDHNPLPDMYTDYPVGPAGDSATLTVADIEQSYTRFVDTYLLFEQSLTALEDNDHTRSTRLWTKGLETMYETHQEMLFTQ